MLRAPLAFGSGSVRLAYSGRTESACQVLGLVSFVRWSGNLIVNLAGAGFICALRSSGLLGRAKARPHLEHGCCSGSLRPCFFLAFWCLG